MDDITVRRHVLAELRNAPLIDAERIGVSVENGVVTLTGDVRNFAEKCIAERVAFRVRGVRTVLGRIEVRYPEAPEIGDEALALRIGRAMSGLIGDPARGTRRATGLGRPS